MLWWVGWLWLVLLWPLPGLAQYTTNGTLYSLQVSGLVSNRLNVVIFSEGFTTNTLASSFLADATNVMQNLFAAAPFQEYQSYFNVYAIAVPSTNNGSTQPYYGVTNHTFFSSQYDPVYNSIISVPTSGLQKMTNLITHLLPQCGLPIILVNYPSPNAAGGGGPAAVIDTGAFAYQVEPHEIGHTLGHLQDEYNYGYTDSGLNITQPAANTCFITNQFSNLIWSASLTNSAKFLTNVSWRVWITNGTLLPTTSGGVGLYLGANYATSNWYRPEASCTMQTLGVPFCSICSEALIKAIYQRARPIDLFNPGTNTVLLFTNPQPATFSVTCQQPLSHNLLTQWFTNGVAVVGATNPVFTFHPGNVQNGSYTLRAQVSDPTSLVLNDPSNLLSQQITWNLNVALTSQLALGESGLGTFSPNYSNVWLLVGQSYSITSAPAAGFVFSNWTGGLGQPSSVLTNQPVLSFLMQSNLALYANLVETSRPSITLSNLVSGQRITNSLYTVTGSATDSWGISGVYWQVNNGAWNNTTGTTNWSATLNLTPGTNLFQMYAVNRGSLATTNAALSFQSVVTNRLTLSQTGLGTFTPNYSNAWLEIGRNYAITSAPAAGFVFNHWTTGTATLTNSTALTFLMASNLALTGTFTETSRPTVTITNLTSGQKVKGSIVTLLGNATDSWSVSGVWCQVSNHGGWTVASSLSTNPFSSWGASNLLLLPGTNWMQVYALNQGGLYSLTNSLFINATNATILLPSAMVLTNPQTTTSGYAFYLVVTGNVAGVIQASPDLTHWSSWTNFAGTNTKIGFLDLFTIPRTNRFYRASGYPGN